MRPIVRAGAYLVALAAFGVGAYALIQTESDSQAPGQANSLRPTRVLRVTIQDQRIVSGSEIKAEQNDQLLLRIRSDREHQFHVEGYHAFANLVSGSEIELLIWTATPGVFPILLEDTKQVVAELVVSAAD
jgi:hypothetical protein